MSELDVATAGRVDLPPQRMRGENDAEMLVEGAAQTVERFDLVARRLEVGQRRGAHQNSTPCLG